MASRRHKTIKIVYAYLIAGSLFLAAAILIFFLTIQLMNIGKISRGVKAAGVELGGLSREQAKELLDRETGEYRQSVLSFVYQDRQFNSDFDGLGIVFNNGVLIQSAYEIGRGPNSFLGLFEQLRALFGYYNLGLDYAIDSAKFREFLQTISRLETPAKDATLMFDEKKQDFIVVEEKSGLIIDRKRLRAELEFNLSNLRRNAINVSLVEDAPEITANETEAAKVQAKEILAQAPYSLKFEDKKWTLNKDLLLGWFNFAAVAEAGSGNKILGADFDSEAVEKYLAVLSQSINREPINAQFEFKNSRVTAFALGQDGRRLNVEKSGEEIVENLKNRRKTIVLAVQIIEPEITAKKADELGIKGLLGRGVSDFSGSPKNRRENIRIGAAKFHGILLKPGEEFSFNKLLGEVGPKQGYLPELVIKRNKTVPEYGGGLCQVSTTAFRAAVNSGLLITDRIQHSFAVKYYNPQGFDAAIYPPSADLKFKNDSPEYVLIQTKIEKSKLTFEFYGTSDGREAKVVGPEEYDKKPDGSMKAKFVQEIYRNGELVRKMTFRSTYRSPDLYPIEKNPLE
ncbi:TPA: hypothetical protein DCZ14_03290 [Candidatus Azambacteria bacterium]|uniref:YoaR-like putative peptidoglycan binding domain-containing protein n=1 Tax=Candidatus Azambacteria bacterium GW2011_GWC1_46_13 TaxID=1618619 RepID=A0A0G1QV83_9BACT|nr:MAG: hypothetical protein UX33_C0024G0004 [Candidatus Azambacteria bacterium GW2011_GWC1_46_13]HBC59403.1 hypothetical protein [Candidatus Azambacteria bacterium]